MLLGVVKNLVLALPSWVTILSIEGWKVVPLVEAARKCCLMVVADKAEL